MTPDDTYDAPFQTDEAADQDSADAVSESASTDPSDAAEIDAAKNAWDDEPQQADNVEESADFEHADVEHAVVEHTDGELDADDGELAELRSRSWASGTS